MNKEAVIWDASSGNRTIWETKDDPRILYTDIEEDLSFKPDEILDCRHTGFSSNFMRMIFFDPPHGWGRVKNSTMFTSPDKEYVNGKWPKWARNGHPRYYGLDKYDNKELLKTFIDDSLKEFYRVLTRSGVLMFKWSERAYPLKELREQFGQWNVMMKIPIGSRQPTAKKSYWLILMPRVTP